MRPSGLHESLVDDSELISLGITSSRIKDFQSTDKKPFESGLFIIIRMFEFNINSVLETGPRTIEVRVHNTKGYSFNEIEKILSRVTAIYRGLEQFKCKDGTTIAQIRKTGQSENIIDQGWNTVAQFCTYRLLYTD